MKRFRKNSHRGILKSPEMKVALPVKI